MLLRDLRQMFFDSKDSEIAERNFEHCGQLKNCCVFQSRDTLKFLRVM